MQERREGRKGGGTLTAVEGVACGIAPFECRGLVHRYNSRIQLCYISLPSSPPHLSPLLLHLSHSPFLPLLPPQSHTTSVKAEGKKPATAASLPLFTFLPFYLSLPPSLLSLLSLSLSSSLSLYHTASVNAGSEGTGKEMS